MRRYGWSWSVYLMILGGLLLVLCYALIRGVNPYDRTMPVFVYMIIPICVLLSITCFVGAWILPFQVDVGTRGVLASRLEDGRMDGSDPRAKESLGVEIQNLNMATQGNYLYRDLGGYDPRMNRRKKN